MPSLENSFRGKLLRVAGPGRFFWTEDFVEHSQELITGKGFLKEIAGLHGVRCGVEFFGVTGNKDVSRSGFRSRAPSLQRCSRSFEDA
jgi:hypothetical protein